MNSLNDVTPWRTSASISLFGLIVQVGHDHVEAVVDGRLAFGLLHPRFPRVVQRLAPVLDREVDDRRRAAERGRAACRSRSRRPTSCRQTACRGACGRRCRPAARTCRSRRSSCRPACRARCRSTAIFSSSTSTSPLYWSTAVTTVPFLISVRMSSALIDCSLVATRRASITLDSSDERRFRTTAKS